MPMAQRVRDVHGATGAPERRVLAAGHVVVQHDEIADVFDLVVGLAVVFVDVGLADAVAREHLHQPHDAALDQVDAGRFQRLDEAAGQADGDAVASPGLAPLAGPELDDARLGEHLAFDVGQQALFGLRRRPGSGCSTPCRCRRGAAAGCATASRRRARWSACRESPAPTDSVCSATALSQNSQCDQSS